MPRSLHTESVTITVLTDVHYGELGTISRRRSDIADILLLRAVHRLNRVIKPDVTVVLGDLVDDGAAPGTPERLADLREILDRLAAPYIAIPGNHDGDVAAFYEVFERPEQMVDLAGVRFLCFIDPEAAGYNATRRVADIARFRDARADHDGPIVALQHVCLVPPGSADVPYNYTNALDIIDAMTAAGVVLSISGHHHEGTPLVRNSTTSFVTAPALCEEPFRFSVVKLATDGVTETHRSLAMPTELGLVDRHVHTQLAYCSENMDVDRALKLARAFGLAGVDFSEHAGQLYFTADQYWGGAWGPVGIAGAADTHDRMDQYLALKAQAASDTVDLDVRFGLEVDIDYAGNLLLRPGCRDRVDHLIGAVHRTASSSARPPSYDVLIDEFMALTARLIASGIDILAHPFRLFRRAGLIPPSSLFLPVVTLLREHRVAAELNFHANIPPAEFVYTCLKQGVRLSFGSDAHNLYEIGDFAAHLQLLADIGFDGDLGDVLV
jgi:histidinol phosphatase-like PHP family hydrolase/predicted phosphodiesterase